MKSLSVKLPFAAFIMGGLKSIETRTWPTNHRGDLLICASLTPHKGRVFVPKPIEQWMDSKRAIELFPGLSFFGQALCVVKLWDCKPMQPEDETAACCEYYTDAFSWHLRNVRMIEMFHIKGQLGLFETPDDLIKYLP